MDRKTTYTVELSEDDIKTAVAYWLSETSPFDLCFEPEDVTVGTTTKWTGVGPMETQVSVVKITAKRSV